MDELLAVRDLKTRFRTPEGTVYAVNRVSFSLNEGGTLAVVGESGCGKSVTMLSILRLIPIPPGEIVSGSVTYRGMDLLKLSEDVMQSDIRGKEIAMVFQDPMTSLNPVLTIGRQLTEPLRVHLDFDSEKARNRAIELLEMVGIPDPKNRLDNYPHQFSGGMRQRVMIAMALACNPSLLIADEPTTALDVTIQAQIIELVKDLRDRIGLGIVWITHDLGVVAGLARARHGHVRRLHRGGSRRGQPLRESPPPLHACPDDRPAARRAPPRGPPEVHPRRAAQPVG